MYSQLLSTYHTWRWGPWISFIYNVVCTIGLLVSYFPKAHVRAEGFTARQILKRIDYAGAFLSIVGLSLFLVALQAGGYTHPWKSAYVLCTLLIGIALVFAWIVWEYYAVHPMVSSTLPATTTSNNDIVGPSRTISRSTSRRIGIRCRFRCRNELLLRSQLLASSY